jgi:hypothetical protein
MNVIAHDSVAGKMKSIAVLLLVALSCECSVIKFEQSGVFSKVIKVSNELCEDAITT